MHVENPSKNLVWLASYPKSGNTWFRSFLTVLLKNQQIDLNKMATDGIFSGKNFVENILDVHADYLTERQIELYQRLAFTYLSETSSKKLYIKIHDAFTFSELDKLPLIPEAPSACAVYFVRNPLDVTLSLANHIGKPLDFTIEKYMVNPKSGFVGKRSSSNDQFHQPLGTWSMHVESWLTKPLFPVHFMRYEDMKEKPFETFKAAVQAMGLSVSEEEIQFALEETRFEKLQEKEQKGGFREKPSVHRSFFFKGEVGRWKQELTVAQIEKISHANEPMMRHFGYL